MISSSSNVGSIFTFREWLVGCALSNPNIIPEGISPDIAAAKAWAYADAIIKFYSENRRITAEFPAVEPPTTPETPTAREHFEAASEALKKRPIMSSLGSSYSFVNQKIFDKK